MVVFTKEDLMDGRVCGWAAGADARTAAAGAGRWEMGRHGGPKVSQDLHACKCKPAACSHSQA